MSDRPSFLKAGEQARLIPVVADTSREKRALSVLLATMSAVREFRAAMLASLGVTAGHRSTLRAYTECVLTGPDIGSERPDGLVVLNTGKRQWLALLEAKIGNAELESAQVERYAECARALGFDALITVSNQFVALPDHHPIKLPKALTKKVKVFHWSWMSVVTQANLVLAKDGVASDDQRYLLEEALRYWRHDSTGISTFDRMNRDWKDLITRIRNRTALNRSAPEVENSVASWHQEQRDLCLLLTRRLGRTVTLRLQRAHREDPVKRLRDDCEALVATHSLRCEFDIPDAAAPLEVTADLATRSIRCSMKLQAPNDKKRTSARVNWLLRQLAKADPTDTNVKAIRPGRAIETEQPLAALVADASALDTPTTDVAPSAFEVFTVTDLGGRFTGNKTFVESVEAVVPQYYERIGQHLRRWVPAPPKISERDPGREVEADGAGVVPGITAVPVDVASGSDPASQQHDEPEQPSAPIHSI